MFTKICHYGKSSSTVERTNAGMYGTFVTLCISHGSDYFCIYLAGNIIENNIRFPDYLNWKLTVVNWSYFT